MQAKQLRLVSQARDDKNAWGVPQNGAASEPARVVFEHWVYMLGKCPSRTKMGPGRRAAVQAALALYGLDMLLQAVDGMAAENMEGKPDTMVAAMQDFAWLFEHERRVELYADKGLALAQRLAAQQREAQAAPKVVSLDPEPTPEEVAAQRARLRDMARQMRGGC